jgi:hypothetical protein
VWLFSAGPPEVREVLPPFRTPVFMRTLGSWLNRLVEAGFMLDRFGEPYPGDEAVRERPGLQDAQVVAYFLHVRRENRQGQRANRSPRHRAPVPRPWSNGRRTSYRRERGTR